MFRSLVVCNDFKDVRKTEKCLLSLTVSNNLREREKEREREMIIATV